MRIAISTISTPAQTLGIGRYIKSLIDALQQIDSHNEYLIYTAKDNYRLFDFRAPNFREVRTDFVQSPRWLMRPAYFAWQNSWFLAELYRRRVDVLHLPNLLPLLFDKLPTVVTIHDLGEYKVARKYDPVRQWYRQKAMSLTVQKARRIIAVSNSTKYDLTRFLQVPSNKIDVTYEGAADIFSREMDIFTSEKLSKKYIDSPYIIYAGALYRHKNLERLIRAFHRVKASAEVPHRLLIVGRRSDLYNQLRELGEQLGIGEDVVYAGYVPDSDLVALYDHASVMAYVPVNEGFGLPIVEAMTRGVPVVASNTSSIPEVAGDAALLVDPLDIESISSALTKVLLDTQLASEMAVKGKIQARKFSWQQCARETLKTYHSAVGDG